ncbi:MAG: rRNA maturation RNase YbeY [Patescibacteria group bacterium]|nr:rRNA maturation RNase YbeY [Patescibacteria group bacterium]
MIHVDLANQQQLLRINRKRLERAVRVALRQAGRNHAEVSLAIVDDAAIAELHGRYLNDPTPTDVLSFPLESGPGRLEGEVIASAETALHAAGQFGWAPGDELLLYVVHGTLHLAGSLDATPRQRAAMRKLERAALEQFDLVPSYRARSASKGGS